MSQQNEIRQPKIQYLNNGKVLYVLTGMKGGEWNTIMKLDNIIQNKKPTIILETVSNNSNGEKLFSFCDRYSYEFIKLQKPYLYVLHPI